MFLPLRERKREKAEKRGAITRPGNGIAVAEQFRTTGRSMVMSQTIMTKPGHVGTTDLTRREREVSAVFSGSVIEQIAGSERMPKTERS